MEIDEILDQIMDQVYHAAIQSDDLRVQERIVRSNAYNLLEEFADNLKAGFFSEDTTEGCSFCEENEEELEDLRRRVKELETA